MKKSSFNLSSFELIDEKYYDESYFAVAEFREGKWFYYDILGCFCIVEYGDKRQLEFIYYDIEKDDLEFFLNECDFLMLFEEKEV